MGTLGGHVLPGTFFILFSLWWTYSILFRYYRSRFNRHIDRYRNTASFLCRSPSCLSKIPLEGILKVVATTIGILGELITGFENGVWAHWGNAQHISMFGFFGMTGIADILYFYRVSIPPGMDYALAIVAFVVEGLLFANHLHGRTHMDVMVHVFLLYLIIGCAVCAFLELLYRHSVVPALGRCFFTFMQGTWFYHVGFILYPLPGMATWDQEDHEQMMIITVMFSWHFAGAVLVMFSAMLLTSRLARRHVPIQVPDDRNGIQYQKIGQSTFSDGEGERRNGGHKLATNVVPNGSALKEAFALDSEDEL